MKIAFHIDLPDCPAGYIEPIGERDPSTDSYEARMVLVPLVGPELAFPMKVSSEFVKLAAVGGMKPARLKELSPWFDGFLLPLGQVPVRGS